MAGILAEVEPELSHEEEEGQGSKEGHALMSLNFSPPFVPVSDK